jgi:type IV secretory pathway ATPase VirB11/archaellum biosynthesis ATPase
MRKHALNVEPIYHRITGRWVHEPQGIGRTYHIVRFQVRAYEYGLRKPRYPVPAVRIEYEWGWSLSECKPTLLCFTYGAYDG